MLSPSWSSASHNVFSPPCADTGCPPLPRLYHGFHQSVSGVEPETVEFFCNHSYALSGDAQRTCQPDGTWSGKQPLCVRGTTIHSVYVFLKLVVVEGIHLCRCGHTAGLASDEVCLLNGVKIQWTGLWVFHFISCSRTCSQGMQNARCKSNAHVKY